ncbi:MAG: hypothetical protein LBK25_00820 [Treponema sp.]|nr:hypothetical protein [Treponema sp.]
MVNGFPRKGQTPMMFLVNGFPKRKGQTPTSDTRKGSDTDIRHPKKL